MKEYYPITYNILMEHYGENKLRRLENMYVYQLVESLGRKVNRFI
ncbi:MAG: hypothetical protein QXL57_09345 [Candidatus Bathyarchaeia archaeon]